MGLPVSNEYTKLIELLEDHPEIPEADRIRLVDLATEIQTVTLRDDLGVDIVERPRVPADKLEKILARMDKMVGSPALNRAQRRAAAKRKRNRA